jgi:hypothetical protein
MKPPLNEKYPTWNHTGFVHWDMGILSDKRFESLLQLLFADIWEDNLPFGLQGVLCLEDTSSDQGGFHCVPTMHKWINECTYYNLGN